MRRKGRAKRWRFPQSDILTKAMRPFCRRTTLTFSGIAAYTSANHEKKVAAQLDVRGVEHFLPLFDSVRRWKDRRVVLQLPLFPGYVFVRMALRDRNKVQQVPGVACLVGFSGRPAALPDQQIEALRCGLERGVGAKPHPYLTEGRRVQLEERAVLRHARDRAVAEGPLSLGCLHGLDPTICSGRCGRGRCGGVDLGCGAGKVDGGCFLEEAAGRVPPTPGVFCKSGKQRTYGCGVRKSGRERT